VSVISPNLAERVFLFGHFCLCPKKRLLLEEEQPLRLGSRALDILIALVEHAGELITKDALIARVWPDTIVVEENLSVHVAALRRALHDGSDGNRYIVTVPGRGYSFVGAVTTQDPPAAQLSLIETRAWNHNLPVRLTQLIEREDAVSRLVDLVRRNRLLTIVGPGGVGKTSIAIAVVEHLLADFASGVRFVDLGLLDDPFLVPSAAAAVLGCQIDSETTIDSVVSTLRSEDLLLVLDNCEHLIEIAALLTAAILRGAPRVRVLATSREPLCLDHEQRFRLSPLSLPSASSAATATAARRSAAVQLFIERAEADSNDFELTASNAPLLVEICRRLDGVPLAIELAAAQVSAFGIAGLASRLENGIDLASSNHRTAPSRQRTLRASLDWSFALLSDAERKVFRRLSIFPGNFSLEAASAAAAVGEFTVEQVVDYIVSLIERSLIATDPSGSAMAYRLFAITRAYAFEKLRESGEIQQVREAMLTNETCEV
jgi:predicted ATPase/DNA-binding winged helix-turn-helix (wHTH) protein